MAIRIIQGTLASSSGNSIFLQPNSGELSGTITSYGAPITSGTISSVNFSFNNSPITIYTTDTFVEVKLDNDIAGTMIFDSTGSYTNAELLGYNPDLLFLSPTNVILRVTNGLAAVQGSYTFVITITYNESTITPTLNNPGIPYVSYTPGNGYYQVSWDAATVSNGDTNITYSLLEINNSIFIANNLSTPNFTSYEVPTAGTEYRFRVFAYYGDQITRNENPDNYIFPELIKQSTIGYYANGTWQECIVHYYNGSEWIECIPYYYDNGWQEINTKIE